MLSVDKMSMKNSRFFLGFSCFCGLSLQKCHQVLMMNLERSLVIVEESPLGNLSEAFFIAKAYSGGKERLYQSFSQVVKSILPTSPPLAFLSHLRKKRAKEGHSPGTKKPLRFNHNIGMLLHYTVPPHRQDPSIIIVNYSSKRDTVSL